MEKNNAGLKAPHSHNLIKRRSSGNYNTQISLEKYVILTFLTAPGEYIEQLLKTLLRFFQNTGISFSGFKAL